jgi:hypothetical protein
MMRIRRTVARVWWTHFTALQVQSFSRRSWPLRERRYHSGLDAVTMAAPTAPQQLVIPPEVEALFRGVEDVAAGALDRICILVS